MSESYNQGHNIKIAHGFRKFFNTTLRHFLVHNQIKHKQIPNSYPELQGKAEAYNKIIKNDFLAVEGISNKDDGKIRYDGHSITGISTKVNYIQHTYKNK